MKLIKRILCLTLCVLLCGAALTGCSDQKAPDTSDESSENIKENAIDIRMAVIKGPTGVGAVNLWANQDAGTTRNNYTFETVTTPDAAVTKLANGEVDVAALPTNAAATLYAKTDGKVQVLAVNTLGVLYMLEKGDTVKSVADLRGKTIYTSGQGSNPEYVLNYILEKNGLTPGKDVTIQFVAENEELATLVINGTAAIAMVPEPQVTTLKTKMPELRTALDMTVEWDAVAQGGSQLMMGCIAANKEFVASNPDGIATFLQEYEASLIRGDALREETGALCAQYGIIDNEVIAANAIVGCNMQYIGGDKMKTQLSGYLQVLYDANPKSVGGEMPDDDFYYVGERN